MKRILIFSMLLLPGFAFSQFGHEWTSAFTGSGEVSVHDVDEDASGNSYIIGTLNGTVDFDPGPATDLYVSVGNIDMFLAKYDLNGNLLWVNVFATQPSGWGIMPCQLKIAQNSIYIGGTFIGTTDFDPGPGTANLTSIGNLGPVFGRYDLNGNYMWAKTVGTENNDHITGLDVDAAGNVYLSFVSGGTNPDFDPGPGVASIPINWNDGVVAKYDNMGNYIFAKTFRSTGGNWHPCLGITVDNTYNVYVTGTFESTIDVDPDAGVVNLTASGVDGYIVKLNPTGNYLWHGQFTGPGSEVGTAIICDLTDNSIYCGGNFESASVDFNIGAGTANLNVTNAGNGYVAKYTSAGAYLWAVNINGNGVESVTDLDLDQCRNVLVSGIFNASSVDLDPSAANTNFSTSGLEDMFLAKYTDAGTYVRGFKIGGTGSDYVSAVSVNPANGSTSLCGNFNGIVDFDPGTATANRGMVATPSGFLANYSEAPQPPADLTPLANLNICPGDSTTLIVNGSAGGTVYWYDSMGNLIGTGDTLFTGVIGAIPTVFYFKDSLTCLPSSDLDSIVIGNGTIDVIITASDTVMCDGSTVTLTASGAQSYTWSPGGETSTSITVSPTSTTTYNLVGHLATCTDSAQVTVTVFPPPAVSIQGDSILCSGESATLIATGANSYTWSPGGFTNDTVTVSPSSTTVYTVIGQSASCRDTAFLTVTVSPSLVISVQGITTLCPGGTAVMTAQGAASYTWSPAVTFVAPDGSHVQASPVTTTVYTVTGFNADSTCSETAQITVTLVDHVDMDLVAVPNPVLAEDPLVTFHGEPSDALLIWHFGDSTSTEGADVQHLYPTGVEATYPVMLIAQTAGGCIDTLYTLIVVEGGSLFYVPNAFTPNGDAYNTQFKPVFSMGFDPAEYQLSIYNRWGEPVFETTNVDEGWNGVYRNENCKQDVYTWKLTFGKSKNAERKEVTGFVTLLR